MNASQSAYRNPNLGYLRERAWMLRETRKFFDESGFLEVQPPCLSRDCIVDPYIDPITVATAQLGVAQFATDQQNSPQQFYLQTSAELAMKRMLAAGAPSIYSIGPVFRAGERGQYHNPEFTMLEWYQVGATMSDGIETLGRLVCELLGMPVYQCHSYRQVFQQHLGFDPLTCQLGELQTVVQTIDAELSDSIADDRDALLDVVFTHRIQPQLGIHSTVAVPVIVKNYPLSQAALARQSSEDPACACRFELFVNGIELANGYDELLDPQILQSRSEANNRRRIESGRQPLPSNGLLLQAMRQGLPASTGVALGFDRLLMVKTNARDIDEVISLPIEMA